MAGVGESVSPSRAFSYWAESGVNMENTMIIKLDTVMFFVDIFPGPKKLPSVDGGKNDFRCCERK
jgi:hypothetical protein